MKKILIVDDEADLRKLLTDYFEINGYFVMTAKDGSEAATRESTGSCAAGYQYAGA